MIEQSISLERMEDTASLFGPFDENIRLIERELQNIPNEKVRAIAAEHIHDIDGGKRDFRF